MTTVPILSIHDVRKSFGDLHAVDGATFEVRPGEIFGFLGPNGAGKTTTLRMIMQIIRPDSGRILFDGAEKLSRRRIGYLPEERGLYEDASVIDTLGYFGSLRGLGLRASRESAANWLARVGLGDRADSKVNTLSKGNQQKVQLIGSILHRPALAVLDEPFSGLDPLNQEMFLSLIQEMRSQGAAVLLSAHQLNLVERLCDRFFLIAKGCGVLEGTLSEIRRKAARGAGEVLSLDLVPSRDDGDLVAAVEAFNRHAPNATQRRAPDAEGMLSFELELPTGLDLGPLMKDLAERFELRRVNMRHLSLHEIYLHAVGAEGDADDGSIRTEEPKARQPATLGAGSSSGERRGTT